MLKSLEWESIRVEKFPLTPIALFESFTSTAESLLSRHAAEIKRRQQWLSSAEAEDGDDTRVQSVPIVTSRADRYGVHTGLFFEVTCPESFACDCTYIRVNDSAMVQARS